MNRDTISTLLDQKKQTEKRPDGRSCVTISFNEVRRIASQSKATLKDVEITALENDITPQRYLRNQTTLSNHDQKILLSSHIAIVGLGGLGGYVTEILSRIGIGTLTLIDGDCFDESNLNRQLFSTLKNLGQPKAKVADQRVEAINAAIVRRTIPEFLSNDNCHRILQGADLAVDCLDSIKDRFVLEHGCRNLKIPLVSAAIAGTSGQLTTISPGKQGLASIYGDPTNAADRGIEMSIGTLPFTAMHMAALQCSEVVKLVLNKQSRRENCLIFSDLEDPSLEILPMR